MSDSGTRTLVVEVIRGRDGKRYPAERYTGKARSRLIRLEHQLVCADGMTWRAALELMLNRWGVRRSMGALGRDLRLWTCPDCPKPPAGPGRVVITPR